jgi:DNA polymerase-1
MKDEIWNRERFLKEYGFEPTNMLDYLSLIGDASDNVPGARGI